MSLMQRHRPVTYPPLIADMGTLPNERIFQTSVSSLNNIIQYVDSTSTIISFNPPVRDPVMLFTALGIAGGLVSRQSGQWTFSAPYEPIVEPYEIAYASSTTIANNSATPGNGCGIVRFPGYHSSITFSTAGQTDGEFVTWGQYVTSTPANIVC